MASWHTTCHLISHLISHNTKLEHKPSSETVTDSFVKTQKFKSNTMQQIRLLIQLFSGISSVRATHKMLE